LINRKFLRSPPWLG